MRNILFFFPHNFLKLALLSVLTVKKRKHADIFIKALFLVGLELQILQSNKAEFFILTANVMFKISLSYIQN